MEKQLIKLAEECPQWLTDHQPGQQVDIQKVLQERILYYPGSGTDGQPIKTFNQFHVVHVFLYVDYGLSREILETALSHDGLKGYHLLDSIEISESELTPRGWQPHVVAKHLHPFHHDKPYCFMNIYERDADYDEQHGSQRFAVIFLYADGHAAYDALFCSASPARVPFVLGLQDHGFGGNYSRFGSGGLMHQIARKAHAFPDYLLVATNTECWENYQKISSQAVVGGMHRNERHLYQRVSALEE